jgi:hypothetical protein
VVLEKSGYALHSNTIVLKNYSIEKLCSQTGPKMATITTGIRHFAECQMFCRVFFWALEKEALCRVPSKKLSVKKHLAKSFFVECFILTLGKEFLCQVSKIKHLAKNFFAEYFFSTLGKYDLKITL